MRRLSLNARMAQDAVATSEIEVILFEINHPDLDAPIRLSTDNAERISSDPLIYGTRSSWRGANPATDPYLFVLASAVLPSDSQDDPGEARIVLDVLDAAYAEVLRSFTDLATIHIAGVLASSPDLIEEEVLDLQLSVAEIADTEISLTLSREEIELEYYPPGRMTRAKFPGLHQ
ncbi:hypothetical protein AQS8620_01415 [Aquimixticola soesokkakensis]|uniref:Uncharacterized protein n=1 Tax=Aquimixticola soesokkakensis TaxID=1519096 RepID=A0A1Y5SD24_9RHOB|nr:hypothetical protein [Aquimixticola soesokkakensis]SLN37944.1 hypothetical protein AQS8620_01415 [Aquimixticola soesokkakensis]